MNQRHSIVCGMDGSEASRSAVAVAATLACALDRRLTLAHVVPDPPTGPYGGDVASREHQRRRAIRDGSSILDEAAEQFDAETIVLLDAPVEGLKSVCSDERIDLLVVGSRGRSRVAAAALGSVSMRVASGAACPVLIVPPHAGELFVARAGSPGGSIVSGVDGSTASLRALTVAAGLAGRLGLQLISVFVDTEVGNPIDGLWSRARADRGRILAVGSEGLGTLSGVLLGSVSAGLAAAGRLPVLVVAPTARLDGLGSEEAADELVEMLGDLKPGDDLSRVEEAITDRALARTR